MVECEVPHSNSYGWFGSICYVGVEYWLLDFDSNGWFGFTKSHNVFL